MNVREQYLIYRKEMAARKQERKEMELFPIMEKGTQKLILVYEGEK